MVPRRMTETRSVTAMISRSLWVMSSTVLPSRRSARSMSNSPVCLGRGQHRGRLVEDQQFGAAQQRFHDLDPLLQPDGQVADERLGVDREAVVARERRHPGADLAGADAEQGARPPRRA